VVASGVDRNAQVGLAVAANGDARMVWYAPGAGANPGHVSSRLRFEATGQLGATSELTASIAGDVRGNGQISALIDGAGVAHVAYHFAQIAASSTPRYAEQVGLGWTPAKTIDNQQLEGLAGFSVALALVGSKRYAAYFTRKTGQTTAELRLASWVAQSDVPEIAVLDQGIPAGDPAAPRYRVAMAADRHGLLHLAIVRPAGVTGGSIEYRRQSRAAGRTTWLTDTVDGDVLSEQSGEALVDLVVDDAARPHIAYVSGRTGDVLYATRYDRP